MFDNYPAGMTASHLFHVGSRSGGYTCPTCRTEHEVEPEIHNCCYCGDDLCLICGYTQCVGDGCHAQICGDCQTTAPCSVTEELGLCPRCAVPEVETILTTVEIRRAA